MENCEHTSSFNQHACIDHLCCTRHCAKHGAQTWLRHNPSLKERTDWSWGQTGNPTVLSTKYCQDRTVPQRLGPLRRSGKISKRRCLWAEPWRKIGFSWAKSGDQGSLGRESMEAKAWHGQETAGLLWLEFRPRRGRGRGETKILTSLFNLLLLMLQGSSPLGTLIKKILSFLNKRFSLAQIPVVHLFLQPIFNSRRVCARHCAQHQRLQRTAQSPCFQRHRVPEGETDTQRGGYKICLYWVLNRITSEVCLTEFWNRNSEPSFFSS